MSKLIMLDHLSAETCERLVSMYAKNKLGAHKWETDNPNQPMYPVDFKAILNDDDFLWDVVDEVLELVCFHFGDLEVEWGEIVYRLKDCSSGWHFDTQSKNTAITSVTYLTDNFEGGETCFIDGTKVKPLVGRTIIFDGNYYKHMVAASSDTRFAMPIWYKQKERTCNTSTM